MAKYKPKDLVKKTGWAIFMTAISVTIVNLANPKIMIEPNFVPTGDSIPQYLLSWNNYLYSIALGAFSIPAAKMGERYGLVKMARIGIAGMVLFSTICGVSKYISYKNTWTFGGFWILLASRFL